MASTTLQTLWQMLARELGQHVSVTATSDVIGPDIPRWFVSFGLVVPPGSPQYDGHWALTTTTTSIQQSLRVLKHVPQFGGLMLDYLSGSGSWLTTATCEVTWPLPIVGTHGVYGLTEALRRAMREVWYPDRIDLTPTALDDTVDLSAQIDWLDSEDRVLKTARGEPCYYDPSVDGSRAPRLQPQRYGELIFDGGSPSLRLVTPYRQSLGSSRPAQLGVIRPVYSLVSGSESTTGPSTAAQTVGGDPAEIVAVAALHCYRYLATATHISDEERGRYAALVGPQEAWVRSNVKHYLPRDEMPQQATGAAA